MIPNIYSAGLMSQSFWFIEFKKVVKLISNGKSDEEIKSICIEENLFGAAKEYRAKRMCGYILNRAKKLDQTMIDLFLNSDLNTQKIINLITILKGKNKMISLFWLLVFGIPYLITIAIMKLFDDNKK